MKRESLLTIREGDVRFISLRVLLACGVPLSAGAANRGGRRTEKKKIQALLYDTGVFMIATCQLAVSGSGDWWVLDKVGGAGVLCEGAGGKRQDLAKVKRCLKETLVYECFWK